MATLAGLMPAPPTMLAWGTLAAVRDWAALPAHVLNALLVELGDADLTNLAVFAAIPPDVIRDVVARPLQVNPGDALRNITAIEAARLNLMVNAIRARFQMPLFDILLPTPAAGAGPAGGGGGAGAPLGMAPQTPGVSAVNKVKLGSVLDQSLDGEVVLLEPATLAEFRQHYNAIMGGNPIDSQEVTDAQLTALSSRCATGQCPYADFGVWQKHGTRVERRLKFTAHFQDNDGTWRTRELPGPENLEVWGEAWAVFKTAAIMASVAHPSTLDVYEARFRERVLRYPDCWHIAVQADVRCRAEFWVSERRRQEQFHAASPTLSNFSPLMPWNSVIRASAADAVFWEDEFKEPCRLFQMQRKTPAPALSAAASSAYGGPAPPPFPPPPPPWQQGRGDKRGGGGGGGGSGSGGGAGGGGKKHKKDKGAGKGGPDQQRKDGRYFRARNGKEICFKFSRIDDGCDEVCPDDRMHICEWCRQPHRTIRCPKHPGWKPTT